MNSDVIKISNDGQGMSDALDFLDNAAKDLALDRKQSFHLRLIGEEMFSMVRSIAGNFQANFTFEESNRACTLRLEALAAELDYGQRKEFLSASTTGKNIATLGIMDKVRELIEAGFYNMEESLNLQAEYGLGMFNYGAIGIMDNALPDAIYSWSMQKYIEEVKDLDSEDGEEAADELEKSIIANIADEVLVGVKKNSIELIIRKQF